MKLIIFLDGDNYPENAIKGIELLKTGDEVYIYESIAKGGKHFKDKYIEELQSKTAAKIDVRFIQTPGKNATDFAIAIDAGKAIAAAGNEKKAYVVISADHDFDIMSSELRHSCPDAYCITRATDIRAVVEKFWLLRVESREEMVSQLAAFLPENVAKDACDNLAEVTRTNSTASSYEFQLAVKNKKPWWMR